MRLPDHTVADITKGWVYTEARNGNAVCSLSAGRLIDATQNICLLAGPRNHRRSGRQPVSAMQPGRSPGDHPACTRTWYQLFRYHRGYWSGHSEEVYGEVLKPFRKQIFLTTKSVRRTRQAAQAALEKSVRALPHRLP